MGHIAINKDGVRDTFNGKQHLIINDKPLVYQDKIINLFVNTKDYFQGGYIEVRNIADGSLNWTYSFDLRSGSQREFPSAIQINDEGQLELFCLRSKVGNNFSFYWLQANLSYRRLDLTNGQLLEYKYKEPSGDTTELIMPIPAPITQVIANGSNISYIYFVSDSKVGDDSLFSKLEVLQFDRNLNIVEEKSRIYKLNYPYLNNYLNFYKHDGFLFTSTYAASERAVLISPNIPGHYELYIDKFDDDWNRIESTALHEVLDSAAAYEYLGIKDKHHIFALRNNINSSGPEITKITTLDFDYNINETVELPVRRYNNYQIHKIPGEKGLLYVANFQTQNAIEIHKSDGNGNLSFIKELETEKFEDEIINIQSEIVHDRYLAITMWVRVIKPNGFADEIHDRIVVSMHDLVELGVLTNVKDVTPTKKLALYPNPTTHEVNIDNLEAPATVTISNIHGQILKQMNNVENTINISDLPAGMYIFDFSNNMIDERHKVVKVE
ncbi:MAG: T9SS type A sorting domain-containing protein [Chitinophagales bacterium]|nr:T9SS type A sorting domain-containing protein [Chitinophagales bacterium]